jgi:translation initiation factor 1 (eIF-1/SUI1)
MRTLRIEKQVVTTGAVETAQSEAEKRFFLKKEAKTFASLCACCGSVNLLY